MSSRQVPDLIIKTTMLQRWKFTVNLSLPFQPKVRVGGHTLLSLLYCKPFAREGKTQTFRFFRQTNTQFINLEFNTIKHWLT